MGAPPMDGDHGQLAEPNRGVPRRASSQNVEGRLEPKPGPTSLYQPNLGGSNRPRRPGVSWRTDDGRDESPTERDGRSVMSNTLYVSPAQVLAAKLAVELREEAGEEPDEALKAIANAEVATDDESDPPEDES